MKTLFKFLLLLIASTTISFAQSSGLNSQLIQTNFSKNSSKSSNPISLAVAGSVLVLAFCAFRFRKKIV
ncbi:hypothetical protein ACTS91_00400 [Empedobacter falsenii]|uniref:LPXTG cell wall anchor domain-containing protein n=1 Tax=Empedobacter falsenii TaxID=343874 RepID=A0A376G8I8_9FLAO|nr:hypothetical protein [Empedobacter falsenii]STD55802.1 Uncharacterised protein [Empedobacter falsenii]HAR74261.1 hypothetical protein [Flavobacteriaceae bacterium]